MTGQVAATVIARSRGSPHTSRHKQKVNGVVCQYVEARAGGSLAGDTNSVTDAVRGLSAWRLCQAER